jgi:hypothetical protein
MTVWSLPEAFFFVVFMVAAIVSGWYWWTWVGGNRDTLPSWGLRAYIASGVIGLLAFFGFIAVHYGM